MQERILFVSALILIVIAEGNYHKSARDDYH